MSLYRGLGSAGQSTRTRSESARPGPINNIPYISLLLGPRRERTPIPRPTQHPCRERLAKSRRVSHSQTSSAGRMPGHDLRPAPAMCLTPLCTARAFNPSPFMQGRNRPHPRFWISGRFPLSHTFTSLSSQVRNNPGKPCPATHSPFVLPLGSWLANDREDRNRG